MMPALGGAVWAALMPMWDSHDDADTYKHHEEPLTYECDVFYRFEILSGQGRNIRNILESQFNRPSEFIRYFTPEYEMNEIGDLLELRMIRSPYKLCHGQVIELLEYHNIKAGIDYNLTWFLGDWNRKTKEFEPY